MAKSKKGLTLAEHKAIGAELKASYYRQAIRNCELAASHREQEDIPLLAGTNTNA